MNVIPGEVIIEPATNRPAAQSQPIQALANLDTPLDDASVRQAIANAEANNQDPQSVTMQDLASAQGQVPTQVPQKFVKTDGTVDVDKLQASTRQLDEAIQKKEQAVQKSVDDYLEAERKFRNMPNPEKLVAQAPQVTVPIPIPQGQLTQQQQEEIVRRDYAADPLGTTTRLLDLMLQEKFRPIEERNQIEARRANIQKIAEKDPRILQPEYFDAVNAKLQADPTLWQLKNPHKAAWLDVKEEMRLGEPVAGQVQAQPSRSTPVLGGGSPPSVPSSSVQSNAPIDISQIDLRDKKQEKMGDELIRQMIARR